MDAVRDYLVHLKAKTNSDENTEIRAVIGIPANTGPEARENVRVAVTGLFDKVILIPEPFLAALGCREVSKSSETGYIDPISNSIFVDIGAGSSDICLIQGYYPSSEDQISFAFAGDAIDAACNALLERIYQAVRSLIVKADPDSIPSLLQNIIMTGGGSKISGIDQALQELLSGEGFEGCEVASVGKTFKTRVATGALIAARQAGHRQWQTLLR